MLFFYLFCLFLFIFLSFFFFIVVGAGRRVEMPALQTAPAGHSPNESVDSPRHPDPPPEALQAGRRASQQALHAGALPPDGAGPGAPHGQAEQLRPAVLLLENESRRRGLPVRSVRRVQPPRRHARRSLYRFVLLTTR